MTMNNEKKDKLHPADLGETRDFKDLSFNEEKNSYEIDVKSDNPDYDHPLPYETTAENGGDDNSDYDEQNPYIGNEYASKDDQVEDGLDELGMHIDDDGDIVSLSEEDELLSRTDEDNRDDLDEEGYPVNDSAPLK
jgi:hypothetical protein